MNMSGASNASVMLGKLNKIRVKYFSGMAAVYYLSFIIAYPSLTMTDCNADGCANIGKLSSSSVPVKLN